jgi:preprotein translocase subunit YajC
VPFTSVTSSLIIASTGSTSKSGGGIGFLVPLMFIVLIGYLLLVRPARNRQRQALQMRSGVEPGVEVTTTAGLIATVVEVDDDTVTLEIAPGVHARFVKAAVGRVNTPPEPPDGSHEQIEPDAVDEAPSTEPPTTDAPDSDSTDR